MTDLDYDDRDNINAVLLLELRSIPFSRRILPGIDLRVPAVANRAGGEAPMGRGAGGGARVRDFFAEFDEDLEDREYRLEQERIENAAIVAAALIAEAAPAVPALEGAAARRAQADAIFMEVVNAELSIFRRENPLERTRENGEHNDPLMWWKDYGRLKYPNLALLALKYLCVQATSAASERLFSAAGLTIANDRASMLPDNASMLIFLHENLPIVMKWRAEQRLPSIL